MSMATTRKPFGRLYCYPVISMSINPNPWVHSRVELSLFLFVLPHYEAWSLFLVMRCR
jgi:hypothetical protein